MIGIIIEKFKQYLNEKTRIIHIIYEIIICHFPMFMQL